MKLLKVFDKLSIYDFQSRFSTNESCLDLLVKLKWGADYKCRNCGYKNYCKSKKYGERWCC